MKFEAAQTGEPEYRLQCAMHTVPGRNLFYVVQVQEAPPFLRLSSFLFFFYALLEMPPIPGVRMKYKL